jgi:hypothetical protein
VCNFGMFQLNWVGRISVCSRWRIFGIQSTSEWGSNIGLFVVVVGSKNNALLPSRNAISEEIELGGVLRRISEFTALGPRVFHLPC